ncbi:MAG: ABC transporter ATP-binding protein [Candidatus Sumerlaeota bacterium]|nr:ABC transporter ATP-binding protein [Candidatus Sumerlaeota bacterium]
MAILELHSVSKHFGGLKALDDVSLQVEAGETFGLIGPNGSGKTTLFNCVSRCFPLTSGRILLNGRDITRLPTHRVCRLGIGRTFQVVRPLKRMTVLDNVIASALLRARTVAEARTIAEETLEFCGLSAHAGQLARSLPIASRKRLEIARALATQPSVLLLDETAAGLNFTELAEAIDLVRRIRRSGTAILIVEHIMKVIMTLCDRIHVIHHGQTIAEGTPAEVARHRRVVEAYLGASWEAPPESKRHLTS